MADIHGSPADAPQMPQAMTPGSAPVPYAGPDLQPEPPDYGLGPFNLADGAADDVMSGARGGILQESPAAHDISAGLADAPYYPGPLAPIDAAGDNDAGGRDDVAASVAQAVQNATDRWHEFQADALPQGSTIGDLIHFPASPLDPGAGVGNTTPAGDFYDPPRDYGGTQGAPGYQGDAL